ncbi:methyl-accepting chemotaxis protein [Anaeromicrobium sediminis]|uniref:Methyl-accepting chemotaxis protein n=1 Tax=Anaeromicrobium sediminis TaxID=1478221 RepID=A0A267MLG2_9FIRM|nr:methyl-accepting chemotaxis protein [Anaeromicrobium sediminis]PAB59748.1 hypothetical protein CCE28_09285 [Anaeromicrobium sediminis]
MKLGIKTKLVGMFIILISIPLLFLGFTSYNRTIKIIEGDLNELCTSTIDGIEISIDNYLNNFSESLNMISKNTDVKEIIEHPEYEVYMIGMFKNFIDSHEDCISIYLGLKDKTMHTYPYTEFEEGFDPLTRPWYKSAYEKNTISWTEPYIDVTTNKLVVTASTPVYNSKDEFIGVIGIDIDLDTLSQKINKMKIGKDGYAALISSEKIMITHVEKEKIGKYVDSKEILDALDNNKKSVSYKYEQNGELKSKLAIFKTIKSTGWTLIGSLYTNEVFHRANTMLYRIIIIGVIFLIVSIGLAYIFSNYITKQIKNIVNNTEKMKQGDLSIKSHIKTGDEFEKLSNIFNDTVRTLGNLISNIQDASSEVRNSSENLAAIAEETSATSEQVGATVEEIARGALSQAKEAEKGYELVNGLSNKFDELMNNTKDMIESTENVVNSNLQGFEAVKDLVQKTDRNAQATHKIEEAIIELSRKSKNIEDILNTITSIAEQTNLLALNASIEAARAGEHGKGFAVVADEIRKLAEGSKAATDNIKDIIDNIQNDSENTVNIMNEVKVLSKEQGLSVSKVNDSFEVISKSVSDITYKTNRISDFVNSINKEKDLIVESIQNIAEVSEESASSSQEVNASMQQQLMATEEVAKLADEMNNLSKELAGQIKVFKI